MNFKIFLWVLLTGISVLPGAALPQKYRPAAVAGSLPGSLPAHGIFQFV